MRHKRNASWLRGSRTRTLAIHLTEVADEAPEHAVPVARVRFHTAHALAPQDFLRVLAAAAVSPAAAAVVSPALGTVAAPDAPGVFVVVRAEAGVVGAPVAAARNAHARRWREIFSHRCQEQ